MMMTSKEQIYLVLGSSRQALQQYMSRREHYEECVDTAERMLLLLRANHGGLGLEKAYYMIKPEGLGRDAFIAQMSLRGHGLKRKRSFVRTTRSTNIRFPNLINSLIIKGINRIWQSDTTYYRIAEIFYYLTFIIDVYSRVIIGYCVSKDLRAQANVSALRMALKHRKNMDLTELIFHSDGGSQYRYEPFVELLRKHTISSSMCHVAQDNAYAEKINDVIKNEYLQHWIIRDFPQLKRSVKKAVGNYNKVRIHGQLPKRVAPLEFEHYLEDTDKSDAPCLLIKDSQARQWEYQPTGVQNLSYPSSRACEGITQILPAFVKLVESKNNGQLALNLQ